MTEADVNRRLGQRIRLLRCLADLSQAQLARRVFMSRPSIAKIELGHQGITAWMLFKLSAALCVPTHIWLYEEQDWLRYPLTERNER